MINSMGAFEYKSDKHPLHEKNEALEKEIKKLKRLIDHLRDEIRYLEEQLSPK